MTQLSDRAAVRKRDRQIVEQRGVGASNVRAIGGMMSLDDPVADLSLNARLAIALICVERYCAASTLYHPTIVSFLDHLWMWPLIESVSAFRTWENQQPDLVTVGLGGELMADLQQQLTGVGIEPTRFAAIIMAATEIVYGSLYGACDNPGSATDLHTVLVATGHNQHRTHLIAAFAGSRFTERGGWGRVLTPAERDAWRRIGATLDADLSADPYHT